MKSKAILWGLLFATLVTLLFLSGSASAIESPPGGGIIPGRYIVLLTEDVDPAAVARQHGLAPAHIYRTALNGFAGAIPASKMARLRADPGVRRIEPDRRYRIEAQLLPTGVDRIEADINPAVAGQTVDLDIAIFDTGIDPDHSDLNVGGGFNGYNPANPTDYDDFSGHGTFAAGIVAAKDNDYGVVGVVPSATVWAIRVCYSWIFNIPYCDASSMVNGLDMVAACKNRANGDLSATCDIKDRVTGNSIVDGIDFASANMSIQTPDQPEPCNPESTAVHLSICGLADAGVPLAISAGNDGGQRQAFPEVIATSAIVDGDGQGGGAAGTVSCSDGSGQDDTLWRSSNSGPEIDLAAPGVCIYSTWLNGGYQTVSGTSAAAPHAAGAMALYLHANGQAPATDAAGAAAIRQAVIDAGLPKGAACSYTSSRSDNDEPLLFVNGPTFGGNGAIFPCVGGNNPPIADAGPDQTVTDADHNGIEAVTLNGSLSSDSDGTIDSYEWSEGGAPLTSGMTPMVDFAVGVHTVTLTVTDNDGATTADQVLITVNAAVGGEVVASSDFATAEGIVVSGTFLATQTQDDVYHELIEAHTGGRPANRHDELNHIWAFNLTGGNHVFEIDAYYIDAGDEDSGFEFHWSASSTGPWTYLLTITDLSDDDIYQVMDLGNGLPETIYIRVVDTDQTTGHNNNDVLYVDHMGITGGGPVTEAPGQATNPNPADGATSVGLSPTLSWSAGTDAMSHDVFLGTTSGSLVDQGNQTSTSFTPGTLDPGTTYYWRIDEVNSIGTTTGIEWSFTTSSGVAESIRVDSITLSTVRGTAGAKHGQAIVVVVDNLGNFVVGETVSGTFTFTVDTGEIQESGSGDTDGSGTALLTTTYQAKKPAFTFCVDTISGTLPYNPLERDCVTY